MYDPQIEFPKPLVREPNVFTVRERVLADGSVEEPVQAAEIDRLCRALAEAGIVSVGICLLNAYGNGVHERALADGIKKALPHVHL